MKRVKNLLLQHFLAMTLSKSQSPFRTHTVWHATMLLAVLTMHNLLRFRPYSICCQPSLRPPQWQRLSMPLVYRILSTVTSCNVRKTA